MIDIVKWDAPANVFAYRFPNCALCNKSQLIVEEGQEAVLVKEGVFFGPIGPGRHTLDTKNFPFLTKMSTLFSTGGKTAFTAQVWYVKKSVPLDVKWGTTDPILVEDPEYHIVLPVRAFGQYGIQITDSCCFLAKLSGALPAFTTKTLSGFFKGIVSTRVKNKIADIVSCERCSLLKIGTRLSEISSALEKSISTDLTEYGVAMKMFMVSSISTDDSDPSVARLKQALAKKAEMSILGFSYEQGRSFDILETAAKNANGAGAAIGVGMGAGIGAGLGAPLGGAMANMAKNVNVVSMKHCANCGAELPADARFWPPTARFCPVCGAKIEK